MNFRMLKKKYRKMYGQNPPKWMKERLIKTMVSPSEYRVITAIGIKANFRGQYSQWLPNCRKEVQPV